MRAGLFLLCGGNPPIVKGSLLGLPYLPGLLNFLHKTYVGTCGGALICLLIAGTIVSPSVLDPLVVA